MPSPHPAVTPEAIAIAKKYGPNVSKGIKAMEQILNSRMEEIGELYETIDSLKPRKKVCGVHK